MLAPSGAVGMLISDGKAEEGGPFTHKVLTLRAGKRTLLDESDDFPESDGLREGSLRLSRDGTLSWKHGDMTRSAPLR